MRLVICLLSVSLILLCGVATYTSRYDHPPSSQTFLDRSGKVIGTLHASHQGLQIWTPLEKIPPALIGQTVRKEDRFFFRHSGINPVSILKSAVQNIIRGRIVRGGSTITQQLARNLIQEKERRFFSRTLPNKFRELIVALGLELRHSKKWILERYLNSIYYGNRCYGIAAAARFYFDKDPDELAEEEIGWLISLPRFPAKAKVPDHEQKQPDFTGRHFMEWAASLSPPGPVVPTTLDLDLQEALEKNLKTVADSWKEKDPFLNMAAVVVDVKTGDLKALIGSRDYTSPIIDGQFNAALAPRQPGSTLKPFAYFSAFSRGFSPRTLVGDEPMSFSSADSDEETEAYVPQNFDRRYHGPMTIRKALANSYNVPAVATVNKTGLSFYMEILRRFGFTTLNRLPRYYGLSLALGSGEVNLLELTNAYAALARGGSFLPPRIFPDKVMPKPTPILPESSVYAGEIASILSDEKARLKSFGFNQDMTIEGHKTAVKTGTSYKRRDLWAVGFNSDTAVGVWIGHSDDTPLPADKDISATRLWHAVMEKLLRGKKEKEWVATAPNRPMTISSLGDDKPWAISSPLSHVRYRLLPFLPKEHQRILAEVHVKKEFEGTLEWFLDDKPMDQTKTLGSSEKIKLWILPEAGPHVLRIEASDGTRQTVPFYVMEGEPLS